MCRVLGVSTSGFYKSLKPTVSERAKRSLRIREQVQEIYDENHQIYGSYKIAEQMQNNDTMESACRNTVAKAMKEMGLKSRVVKSFSPKTTQTDLSKKPADNILDQDFHAESPNQKWVTDNTYLAVADGWVYLAVVLDLSSRKVVGTSGEYQRVLKTMNITCSMSRKGCCYDNAVMERFFWSLKHEWTNIEDFADIHEAEQSVFEYIEAFYNSNRIHQALGYQSPDQFEATYESSLVA